MRRILAACKGILEIGKWEKKVKFKEVNCCVDELANLGCG